MRRSSEDRTVDYSARRVDELAEQLHGGMLLYAPPAQSAVVRDFVHARALRTTPEFQRLEQLLGERGLRLEPDESCSFFWTVVRTHVR